MINHLAMNPVNGGRPPKDSNDKDVAIFARGEEEEWLTMCEI